MKNRNSWLHFPVLFLVLGDKDGAVSGESTRLPTMWPGFKSRRQRHMWVLSLLLVLSLAPRDFSPGTPAFPCPSQKPTFSNSNSTRNRIDKEPLCRCATSKSLYIFIYYYIYLLLNWSRPDFHRSLGHSREETVRGRSAGSFNEQRLIIEPTSDLMSKSYYELYSQISDYWVM